MKNENTKLLRRRAQEVVTGAREEIRETILRETARAGVHRFENAGDASGDAA